MQKVRHILHCGRVRDLETMPADSATVKAPKRIIFQRTHSLSARLQSSAAPLQSHGMPHLHPNSNTDFCLQRLALLHSSDSGMIHMQQQ